MGKAKVCSRSNYALDRFDGSGKYFPCVSNSLARALAVFKLGKSRVPGDANQGLLENITILDVFVGYCGINRKTDGNVDRKPETTKRVVRDGGDNVALGNTFINCSDLG